MRILAKFARTGALCMISHLDLMRCVQRTLRRARVPMAYSQGFNPHPLLSFGQALGVGLLTQGDYFEIALEEDRTPQALAEAFNAQAPEGLHVVCAREMAPEEKSPMARVQAAQYALCAVEQGKQEQVNHALMQLFACSTYPYIKKTKKGEREDDLRAKLFACTTDAAGAHAVTACGNDNLPPAELIRAICALAQMQAEEIVCVREDILTRNAAGQYISLFVQAD